MTILARDIVFQLSITAFWAPQHTVPQKVKLNFMGIRGGNGDILGGAPKKNFFDPSILGDLGHPTLHAS